MLIDSIRFRVRRSNPIDSDQIIPSISHIIIAHFNRSRVIFQRLILGLFGKTEPVFFLPIEWPLVSIIESVRFDRWRFRGGIERILRRPRARIASRAPSTKNRPSPFTQKLRKRKKNRWTRLFVLFCFVFYRVLPSLKKPDRPDYARPPSLRLLCGHLSGLRSFSLFFLLEEFIDFWGQFRRLHIIAESCAVCNQWSNASRKPPLSSLSQFPLPP